MNNVTAITSKPMVKTDEQHIDALRTIKAIADKNASISARELGEEFNAIKGAPNRPKKGVSDTHLMSAEDICEAAGVSYNTASLCGRVVIAFPHEADQKGLPFYFCQMMLPALNHFIKLGTPGKFKRFVLDMASARPYLEDYDPAYKYHKPYSKLDIKRQVKILTKGLTAPEKPEVVPEREEETITVVQRELADLPAKKRKKIERVIVGEIRQQHRELGQSYEAAVHTAAEEMVKPMRDEAEEMRRMAREDHKKTEKAKKQIQARLRQVNALMSKEEYRLILNCLHPDRAPEDRKDRFQKAFDIVKRLEMGVKWD